MTDKTCSEICKARKGKANNQLTFFFCFPPPDLAGLDDGGGAFSFLGACNTQQPLMLVRPKKNPKSFNNGVRGDRQKRIPTIKAAEYDGDDGCAGGGDGRRIETLDGDDEEYNRCCLNNMIL